VQAKLMVQPYWVDFGIAEAGSQSSRERGIFNQSYIDRLLAAPEKHFTRLNGSKLWHSAVLEYWLQQHIG